MSERTEYLSMSVTPEVAREFRLASDNKVLQDEIIRRFVAAETKWLEDEVKKIDEATVIYRSKLIGIRESFAEAQDSYVAEIEAIYLKADEVFRKVDGLTDGLKSKMERTMTDVRALSSAVNSINVGNLERLVEAVGKFNAMTADEKAIVTLLLGK